MKMPMEGGPGTARDVAPRPIRLAYLVTHPIQYQAPLLRAVAAEPAIDLTVFFCSDLSVRGFVDPGFGRAIAWDVPLLEGYRHAFLPAVGRRDRLSFWRPFNYGLASRLKRGQFDALWVHGYARWLTWVAVATAKRLGMTVLMRDEAWEKSAPRGLLKRLLKRGFFLVLRQLCDGFLAIGSLNSAYYRAQGIPGPRIFLVPYAVDNAYFRARAEAAAREREELRASLGLETGRPIILFASKFLERKRPDDLLEAYARISRDPALRRPYLLLIGDGAVRGRLEHRVEELGLDAVRFLGFKGQSELPAYYDLADLFVLPSTHEPWGLVVNEAMNAGCAIIVSDQVGAGADLVRNEENGFVVPAGDRAALADALRRVLAGPERCRAMGQRSLEIVAHWSFREDIAGLKAALSSLRRAEGTIRPDTASAAAVGLPAGGPTDDRRAPGRTE